MPNLGPSLSELFGAGNSGRTTKATVQAARTVQSAAISQEQFQTQMLEQMVFQSQTLAAIRDLLIAQQSSTPTEQDES